MVCAGPQARTVDAERLVSCYLLPMHDANHLSSGESLVLHRLRLALEAAYGNRLERIVLIGSRARGDAQADSDFDVAVFLRGYQDLWSELQPLGAITTEILLETGAVISAKPFPAAEDNKSSALMTEIRREGIGI